MFKKLLYLLITVIMAITVLTAAGCSSVSTAGGLPATSSSNEQPVAIVSVSGPLQPINPGGPIVEVTLKNVSTEPVVSLTATLETSKSFDFTFSISTSKPLLPDESISSKHTLIGGGFSDDLTYPLTINGIFQNGDTFTYTEQVRIVAPASSTTTE